MKCALLACEPLAGALEAIEGEGIAGERPLAGGVSGARTARAAVEHRSQAASDEPIELEGAELDQIHLKPLSTPRGIAPR